ncbi:MAG TPA: hypothetical protein VLC09_11825 [Polyangiaceae bacterium]|nr:hypothetical protein [Polyangiaceae bacterium]
MSSLLLSRALVGARRTGWGIALCVAVLGVAGCGPNPNEQLLGSQYRSTTSGEVGLGPDGPVFGDWEIYFVREDMGFSGNSRIRDAYYWSYSDHGDAGTFSFRGNTVVLQPFDEGSEPVEATYDPETNSLELEGKTYIFEKTVHSL